MTLEIALDADEEWDSSTDWARLADAAARSAILESAFPQLAAAARSVEISVRLTSDAEVRVLNAEWRGKDKPTNVLSFPMLEEDELNQAMVAGPELLLGDLVLARGVCESEAADKGVAVATHATHLMVHGTLHLLGYDHGDDDEAEDMEAREVRALARLGIADPYQVND
ncbi:rRNA maturation RNase YbeY [Sphingomonas ginkgonis]|uniref:Endoribonuclease YbeY n=1 Tax=Sphingomonas ginkgonis TaxID=2315330 RepID=A0A429VCS7_9SPHN|nr:rRNA maturation RNase YbeY [Sphingomonas ginkgonis]RST31696.1 rRNA maturation RNase YbeY [Sphingomonas ginkgonis]